jgi:hypothetical protein
MSPTFFSNTTHLTIPHNFEILDATLILLTKKLRNRSILHVKNSLTVHFFSRWILYVMRGNFTSQTILVGDCSQISTAYLVDQGPWINCLDIASIIWGIIQNFSDLVYKSDKFHVFFIIPRRKFSAEDIVIVSVRPSVRPSVLPSVLPSEMFVRSISLKVFELSTWNFIGG